MFKICQCCDLIRNLIGDNSLDSSEVFEVGDDKRPLPDMHNNSKDEERRLKGVLHWNSILERHVKYTHE